MSTPHNKREGSSHWLLGMLLNFAHMLLLGFLGVGLLFVIPSRAQSTGPQNVMETGSILGTAVDDNNNSIPNATVVLHKPVGDPLTAVTKDDGSFAFHDVEAGIEYQIAVA